MRWRSSQRHVRRVLRLRLPWDGGTWRGQPREGPRRWCRIRPRGLPGSNARPGQGQEEPPRGARGEWALPRGAGPWPRTRAMVGSEAGCGCNPRSVSSRGRFGSPAPCNPHVCRHLRLGSGDSDGEPVPRFSPSPGAVRSISSPGTSQIGMGDPGVPHEPSLGTDPLLSLQVSLADVWHPPWRQGLLGDGCAPLEAGAGSWGCPGHHG